MGVGGCRVFDFGVVCVFALKKGGIKTVSKQSWPPSHRVLLWVDIVES